MRDDLVTVASFDNDLDASLARECLASAGIRSFLADHSLVGTAWHLAGALGGVKLQVSASQRNEAAAILARAQAGELEIDEQDWPEGDEEADDETAAERSERDQIVDRAGRSLVLALLFLPVAFYTGWLLLDVITKEGPISAKHGRRAIWIGAGTAVALAIVLILLREMVRSLIAD
ncbi:putative signal transducing protein [Lacipirellula sp.]|uniref:putative signal transducing protein n=1 Tax=Lacipirellula sp. TaxID=2691419 RepID=UPI003D0B7236